MLNKVEVKDVKLRRQGLYTQAALAAKAGCCLRTVQKAENGLPINPIIAKAIERALKCKDLKG